LDAIFILKPLNIFYFTGAFVNGVFILTKEEQFLFVRRPKERELQTNCCNVNYIDSFKDILSFGIPKLDRIGLELDAVPFSLVRKVVEVFALDFNRVEDVTNEIRVIRMVKDEDEIERIKEGGKIASRVLSKVPEIYREGMTERDLLVELEYISRKEGNLGVYRMHSFGNEASFSHILQGESALVSSYLDAPTGGVGFSPAFPQGASEREIEKGKPFTVDVMINYDGYVVDVTRTFCVGKTSSEVRNVWQKLWDIFNSTIELLRSGNIPDDIYTHSLKKASDLGVSDIFMGVGRDRVKFIGHGVGLEVDEYPFIAKGFRLPLKENTVLALEPKLISKDFGIMGVENTYIVRQDGPESVICFPADIFEI